jgi:hypothetical protein
MRMILIHMLACYTNYGITSFTICHSGLYGKIMMVSANRRTCLFVLGLNSSSGSGVAANGQERLNSSLGSRVAASGQEGLNSSSGSGVAASSQNYFMNSFHFRRGWKYYASCPLHTILFTILTCAQRTRVHFCPQHWLLCHLGLY